MQQKPNNKFDQNIKGKFEDASIEPPAFLWNKIEKRLLPVTPWYSKYKYLLLLLSLVFTSASSIFVYKTFFVADKQSSPIALNKRMLKDEIKSTTIKKNNKQDNKKNSILSNKSANVFATDTLNENNESATQNKSTVASFYDSSSNSNSSVDNNKTANQTAIEFKKREERMKRFEVKNDSEKIAEQKATLQNIEVQKREQPKNNTSKIAVSTLSKNTKNKKAKPAYGSDIPTVDDEVFASNSKPIISSKKKNGINENIEKTEALNQDLAENISIAYDITQPIVEPIRNTNEQKLYASAVPVKENVTPLSSREALRALIEKDKLESLDIMSMSAGVEDLNPNKEKMLKNLKQFAGYSIHKGFHVGAFIGINNVWLSKKEFSSDENTSSIKPKVQFGKAYGINIGYDFSDRMGVELEWQISEQGQKYKVGLLSDDKPHTKDINLLYTKFPVLFKYKQTFINNYNSKPIAINFLVGPQFNVLIKQDVKLDGAKINNAPQYNKFEFGVLGGFDFDLYMMRYLYLTIGARTGFASSLKKEQPMSFQLGITTQLNFRYAKKIK